MPFTAAVSSGLTCQILAGAEGFEPPSSVLETDSLTVELTPLLSCHPERGVFCLAKDPGEPRGIIARLARSLTSLLYAAYASGTACKISSAPAGPESSSGS